VSALQVTAQKIIGTTEFRGKNAPKEHPTQRRQQDNGHFWSDDKRIVAKQTLTQTLKHKLRQAREEGAPAHVIADVGKSHAKEKHELLKLQHQMRQKIVTDAVASSASASRCLSISLFLAPLAEVLQPIPLGVTFSKAHSSKLGRLCCHVSVKRDFRALSFEL